ncbi:6283_t:CDS:2, partial [Entrophospora sp. SA101]
KQCDTTNELEQLRQEHISEINKIKSTHDKELEDLISATQASSEAKNNELEELRNQNSVFKKQIKGSEEQLQEFSDHVTSLTQQHAAEELDMLKQQYQGILDNKEKELEELKDKLKGPSSKDLEALHQAHNAKIAEMEEARLRALEEKDEQIKTKSMENRWLEEENDQQDSRIEELKKENDTLKADNEEMLKMIHQLQVEKAQSM